jgi:ABC-type transport system involved in multi-copper enzyme maturation permease subunit
MFRTLFAKEILESLASRRSLVVAALCCVMIPLGLYVSTRDYETRLQNYREAVRLYEESAKKVQDVLYGAGGKAFRAPSPLSFMAMGLENVLPNIAETPAKSFEAPVVLNLSNNQSLDNLYEAYHGALDLVFIVSVIMTFLAMVSTYGAVSGEKEQGTLKQILANAVPRHQVLLAKAAAHYLMLVVPFAVALVVGLLLFPAGRALLFGPGSDALPLFLAGLFSLLLLGVFFNLGLFLSALTKQAATTIVVLLLVWVFLFGVHPRLGAALARLVYPVKPDTIVALEKNQLKRDNERELNAEIDKILASAPDRPGELPPEVISSEQMLQQQYHTRLVERWREIDGEIARRRAVQTRIASNLARLSPVACFIRPLAEISRTGWLEYQRFSSDVARFEEILNNEVYEKNAYIRSKGGVTQSYEGDIQAPAPRFAETEFPDDRLFSNVLPDLVLLVVFNLLFFAGAFAGFLRYDVR